MDERAAWDRFWSYDRLSSFGTGSGSGNYGEPIAAGWRAFFARLPKGSRVLDIATGNGAIAVMAVEAGDGLQVTGADLAQVKPAAFVRGNLSALKQVRFLAETAAEELPLEDKSFDAVVSQYGVEYSDIDRSIAEAVRVLAPGGRLRFACHAAEGTVAADTKHAIADAEFLLDEADPIAKAAECITAILAVERGRISGPLAQTVGQAKYAAFRDALQSIAIRSRAAADMAMLASVHQSLTGLFEKRLDQDEAVTTARLAELRLEVEAHRQRERALLAAARTSEQMAALGEQLKALGLGELALGEQRNGDNLIGYVIEARSLVD